VSSVEEWTVNFDGSIDLEVYYDSCCSWGYVHPTIYADDAEQLYAKLKEHFETKGEAKSE
jgi:hypothetical protein